jgi:beta-1,4-mannosyl-glycoprotein beta-1,4-N-acetylglucosaminyltransferase
MYYDDELTLSLRLNILDKYIDKFVIVEATRDHAGNVKKLNFDKKKFLKFEKKNHLSCCK